MHVQITDTDGDVHVAPAEKVYLDSEITGDEPLVATVVRLDDYDRYEVTKEEFARLLALLTGRG